MAVYAAVVVGVLLVGARWIRDVPPPESVAADRPEGVRVSSGGRMLVVHVAGAVRHPGVYRLPHGSRVADAVRRAGGGRDGAAEGAVNLAARLSDGQQIVVPSSATGNAAAGGGPSGAGDAEGPISLGSATVEQLQEIEGVGPVTAEKIVEHRTKNGGFSSIEDLGKISGIGPKRLESLRDKVQP